MIGLAVLVGTLVANPETAGCPGCTLFSIYQKHFKVKEALGTIPHSVWFHYSNHRESSSGSPISDEGNASRKFLPVIGMCALQFSNTVLQFRPYLKELRGVVLRYYKEGKFQLRRIILHNVKQYEPYVQGLASSEDSPSSRPSFPGSPHSCSVPSPT